jgi:hypothetical protein
MVNERSTRTKVYRERMKYMQHKVLILGRRQVRDLDSDALM